MARSKEMASTSSLLSGFNTWKVTEFRRELRAKATLVARGFGQRAGVVYFKPCSP